MEENYNKKIAPFQFDPQTGTLTRVNVDVSIDILGLLKFIGSIQILSFLKKPKLFCFQSEFRMVY